MMEMLTFKLLRDTTRRPAFEINRKLNCLFDTGATVSVVTKESALLFGDNYKVTSSLLSGFGGKGEILPIHYWKSFRIVQGKTALEFKDFLAFVRDYVKKWDLVLSPYFLDKIPYGIEPGRFLKIGCSGIVHCKYKQGSLPAENATNEQLTKVLPPWE